MNFTVSELERKKSFSIAFIDREQTIYGLSIKKLTIIIYH